MADPEPSTQAAAAAMAAPPLVDDLVDEILLRLLPDDLVDEILLRLPPDDPASLAGASLVCRPWRRILSDPAFRARYRAFHGAPPLLGFLHVLKGGATYSSRFVSASASALRPAGRDLRGWLALDCRHGRALFAASVLGGVVLVVWNPVANEHRRLPRIPPSTRRADHHHFNAAVLCAAEGCDHGDCRGGPFRVVFVVTSFTYTDTVTSARVYSSESGTWGEPTSLHHREVDSCVWVDVMPSVLVGDAIYFSCGRKYILEYQLSAPPRLSLIVAPPFFREACVVIIKTEAGVLEFADVQGSTIYFWSREVDANGAAGWALCRTIELETLLPDGALPTEVEPHRMPMAHVSGFVEGTDVIFVGTSGDVYMVRLNSRRVTKVLKSRGRVVPYVSFYIPAMEAVSTGEGSRNGASSA